jgi:hypothetical protein
MQALMADRTSAGKSMRRDRAQTIVASMKNRHKGIRQRR